VEPEPASGTLILLFTDLEGSTRLWEQPWAATGALRVRMGLHAGEAATRSSDYFGPVVNRTARIMAAGHGGQVLLSAAAAALAADRLPEGADLRDLDTHRLKDLGRPERLFQLVHPDLADASRHWPPSTAVPTTCPPRPPPSWAATRSWSRSAAASATRRCGCSP
jgi:class 3 adenylate cyclase